MKYEVEAVASRNAGNCKVEVSVSELSKVIEDANLDYNLSDRSGESYACGAPDYRSVYIARAVAEWLRGGAQ